MSRIAYGNLKVSEESKHKIIELCESIGIEPTNQEDLHCTIMYSRENVDKLISFSEDDFDLPVEGVGSKLLVLGKDTFSVVIALESSKIIQMHNELIEEGASYDYPEFIPHVSVAYYEDPSLIPELPSEIESIDIVFDRVEIMESDNNYNPVTKQVESEESGYIGYTVTGKTETEIDQDSDDDDFEGDEVETKPDLLLSRRILNANRALGRLTEEKLRVNEFLVDLIKSTAKELKRREKDLEWKSLPDPKFRGSLFLFDKEKDEILLQYHIRKNLIKILDGEEDDVFIKESRKKKPKTKKRG